jgi:hypothetical protein
MRSMRREHLNAIIKYFNARDVYDMRSKHKMKFLHERIINVKVTWITSRRAMQENLETKWKKVVNRDHERRDTYRHFWKWIMCIFRKVNISIYFMLFSGLLIYAWKLYLIISQWKLSKYNFTLFNDETTFPMWYPNFLFAYNSDKVSLFKEKQKR